jgi:nicotinamidase-related amidase
MTTALLIIDVQRVLTEGRWACHDSPGVIERINALSRKARAAAAPVVVIQHETAAGGDMDHGSDAWKLAPALETREGDLFVRKTATDSFHKTGLDELLKARGVDNLVICGMQSDFCVDTTTRRAMALGYPVQLVADGHSTVDNRVLKAPQIIAHHNETLANIESFGPRTRAVPAAQVEV